jgi:A/G-specific adenine glycosylase
LDIEVKHPDERQVGGAEGALPALVLNGTLRARNLLAWYFENARALPWRESHDPYRIWLSEVMLQQTQVVTVLGYYERFLQRYPNVQALAAADEEDVLKLWEGLGYYSRARRLIPCARAVVERHGGEFPPSKAALLALPGIGPYTAGAILSIAWNQRVTAIDGNVLRVASRWYALKTDIRLPAAHVAIETELMSELPADARHFNQALMELGACVCTPRSPKCETCPVRSDCKAYELGLVEQLPFKSRAKAKVESSKCVAYVTCKGQLLIEKRSPGELLGSLWGFPVIDQAPEMDDVVGDSEVDAVVVRETSGFETVESYLEENYDLRVRRSAALSQATHVFTHRIWNMTLIHFEAEEAKVTDLPETRWIHPSELKHYALPTAFRKLLRHIQADEVMTHE